jgi:hypothetical protein
MRVRERVRGDKKGEAYLGDKIARADEKINEKIAKRGTSMAIVAIAWSLSKPFMTAPTIGMSKIERVEEAVKQLILVVEGEGGLQTVLQGLRGSRTSVNILIFVAYSTLSKLLLLPFLEKWLSPRRTSEKMRNAKCNEK